MQVLSELLADRPHRDSTSWHERCDPVGRHVGLPGNSLLLRGSSEQAALSPTGSTPVPTGAELANRRSDLFRVCPRRELAGIKEADYRARIVPLERLGNRRQQRRIVLAQIAGWTTT
jgi:hypothetical protein